MKQIKILKNLFLGSFLLIFMLAESKAQNIFTGNVLLETQEEVVAFGANNYNEITGNLEIGQTVAANVTDLTPLLSLTAIGGNLYVSGEFTNLNGLNNLIIVGGSLWVAECSLITNIDELSNISIIGKDIYFEHNTALLSVDGLIGIKSVNGSLTLNRNRALTNVDGFRNITSVSDSLYLFDNLFINLDGFENLTTIGAYCEINRHFDLTNIDGLSNLTTIGGSIKLHNNQSLSSIDGLSKLHSVAGNLQVTANTLVDRFCGLFALLNVGGLAGTYTSFGNLTNPTMAEIIAGSACTTVAVEENFSLPTNFELSQNYPNPFNPTTKISYSIPAVVKENFPSLQNVELKIYDVLGKEVATLVNEVQSPGNYKVEFDASKYSSGRYFYKIEAGDPSAGSGHGFVQIRKMMLLK